LGLHLVYPFIFSAFSIPFIVVAKNSYSAKMAMFSLLALIACLFINGMVTVGHSLKILLYLLTVLTALLLINAQEFG